MLDISKAQMSDYFLGEFPAGANRMSNEEFERRMESIHRRPID